MHGFRPITPMSAPTPHGNQPAPAGPAAGPSFSFETEDTPMYATGFDIDMECGVAVVRFDGPDVSHLQMLEVNQACSDKLRYDGVKAFVFDLACVELFASACVGALVELLREVEPTRGRIALANCTDNVAFLFRVTRLDDIFTVFDDTADAIAELSGR